MNENAMHGDTFVEKRKHPRLPVKITVHYQRSECQDPGAIHHGQSHNLAVGGIAIRCDHPLIVKECILLDLFIPAEENRDALTFMSACPEGGCRKITAAARVAWCTPFEDDRYVAGIEFLHLEEEDFDYLNTFLQDFKIPEPSPAGRAH